MIFSGDLADKVLSGEKTQTRRPVKYDGITRIPCQYKVGRTYAIQRKRGTHGLGPRILILSVERERVSSITPEDAHAEGFATTSDFLERWHSFYEFSYPGCWRIEFRLVEGSQ